MKALELGRRIVRRGSVLAGVLGLVTSNSAIGQTGGMLSGAELTVVQVSDSGDYLVYEYSVVNGSGSSASIAGISLDLSAVGAGHSILAMTGRFDDGVATRPGGTSFTSHVPFGAISPNNWQAFLMRFGTLEWFGIRGGTFALDTVAVGTEATGFGLRSPYLPGLRDYSAEPSWQSCCSSPMSSGVGVNPGEHYSPEDFAASGVTVGPTRAASDLVNAQTTLNAVSSDLTEVCALGWVSNRTCRSLNRSINRVLKDLGRNRTRGVMRSLGRVITTLEGSRGRSVNENAYWLLRVNLEYAISQL